jgi:hypothetical protein
VTLGLSEEAAAGYDTMDMPQPPAPIHAAGTVFYIATDDVVARLTRSVQPADGSGAEWRIVVNAPDAGVLRWAGCPAPPGHRISLSAYGGEWDLGKRGFARVPAGRQELVARLLRDVPGTTALLPNYPNPFNPETWIPFELNEDARVRIEIYATTGEIVRVVDLGHRVAGRHVTRENAAHWDGRNTLGESVASGTYLYVLRAGSESRYGRMVVVK